MSETLLACSVPRAFGPRWGATRAGAAVIIIPVATFDIAHHDPAPVARAAAIRSGRERDSRVRDRAAAQTMAERLREGFRLARFADRLREAAR